MTPNALFHDIRYSTFNFPYLFLLYILHRHLMKAQPAPNRQNSSPCLDLSGVGWRSPNNKLVERGVVMASSSISVSSVCSVGSPVI